MPSAVWLGILWLGMIAGFGIDIPRYLNQNPPPRTVVHVYAVVFSVWILVVTLQVLMVLGDRILWHRRFGWFTVSWAFLMALSGPWGALSKMVRSISNTPFLSVNVVNRRRLMRQFVIGASALVAAMFSSSCLYFWSPWKERSGMVAAWTTLGL